MDYIKEDKNDYFFPQFRVSSGRNVTIDLIKLFASLVVILGHCIMKFVPSGGTSNPLFNMIWLTQMPLFMFAAGLVAPNKSKINKISIFLYRILKNVVVLIFPCITYLLLNSIVFHISIVDIFTAFIFNPEKGLWFLFVLFFIHLIFDFGTFLASKINNNTIGIVVPILFCSVVSVVIGFLVFRNMIDRKFMGSGLLAYYLPYFCFGFLIKTLFSSKLANSKAFRTIFYVILELSVFAFILISLYFPSVYNFDDSNITQLVIRVVGSISSIVIFLFLFDRLSNFNFCKKISKLGSFSLQCYYIHMFMLKFFVFSNEKVVFQWLTAFSIWGLLVLSVAIVLLLMYNIPFSHLIVFGKSFSRYKLEKRMPKLFR